MPKKNPTLDEARLNLGKAVCAMRDACDSGEDRGWKYWMEDSEIMRDAARDIRDLAQAVLDARCELMAADPDWFEKHPPPSMKGR